jgi:hypothetical protein
MLGIEIEVAPTIRLSPEDFNEAVNAGLQSVSLGALAEELVALFWTAAYLVYWQQDADIPILNQSHFCSGVSFLTSDDETFRESRPLTPYAFPVVFTDDQIDSLGGRIEGLSEVWHLPMWPLHRFILAHNRPWPDMECLLDLVFTLDGLFRAQTASSTMKWVISGVLAESQADADWIEEVLTQSFRTRNRIVHDSQYFNWTDPIEFLGETVPHLHLLLALRRLVTRILLFVFERPSEDRGAVDFRLRASDLVERLRESLPDGDAG